MRKLKVNKVLCCTLALFMAATVDNGYAVGNLFKGLQASAQTVSDSLQTSDDSKNVLKYDNKIQADYGTRYIVKVSRNAEFPDGYGAYIEEMSKEDAQECVDYLNEKLSDSKQEVADYVHPMDISVTNEVNENASDLGSMVES